MASKNINPKKVDGSALPTSNSGLGSDDLWQDNGSVRVGTSTPTGGSSIYTDDGTIGSGRVLTLTDTLTFNSGTLFSFNQNVDINANWRSNKGNIAIYSNDQSYVGLGFHDTSNGYYGALLYRPDTDNFSLYAKNANGISLDLTSGGEEYKFESSYFTFKQGGIINGTSKIGSETISLQGSTLIKGEGTSTGSTLALYDNDTTPNKTWEWLDNGNVVVGQNINFIGDSASVGSLKLYRPANPTNYGAGFDIDLNNSANIQTNYGRFGAQVVTNTSGSEYGKSYVAVTKNGVVTVISYFDSVNGLSIEPVTTSNLLKAGDVLTVSTNDVTVKDVSGSGTALQIYRENGGVGTGVGFNIDLNNSSNSQTTYGRIVSIIESNTIGSETGRLELRVADSGTVTTKVKIKSNTTNIVIPTSNSGLSAGDLWEDNGVVRIGTSTSSIGGDSIYTADGTLSGDRIVDLNGNDLDFKDGDLSASLTSYIGTSNPKGKFFSIPTNRAGYLDGSLWFRNLNNSTGTITPHHRFYSGGLPSYVGASGQQFLFGKTNNDSGAKFEMLAQYSGMFIHNNAPVTKSFLGLLHLYPDTGNGTVALNVENPVGSIIMARANSNREVILRGTNVIGSETISLQGSTLIKGEGTSTGTTLALYDNDTTPNKTWEWLDNGNVNLTKASILTNAEQEIINFKSSSQNPYIVVDAVSSTNHSSYLVQRQGVNKWLFGNEGTTDSFRIRNLQSPANPITISNTNIINLSTLPTSNSGLSSGDLWDDNGSVRIGTSASNGGSGTKVLVKGAMGANQTATSAIPIVEFVTTGTPAGGSLNVNGEWDNTNHKFTVGASGAGTYLIQSQLFLNNGTGWSTLYLYKNGSIYSSFGGNGTDTTGTWDNLDGTIAIDLVVGDYIDIRAYSSSNGTINFNDWASRQAFSITKVSAVAPAAGTDVNALHTNISNEINSVTEKTDPSNTDKVLIEESDGTKKSQSRKNFKRPIVSTTTSTSSLTPSIDDEEAYVLTALSDNLTINAPTGSPYDFQNLWFRITDNGVSRTITKNAIFVDYTGNFPTSTTINKQLIFASQWDGTNWNILAWKTQP